MASNQPATSDSRPDPVLSLLTPEDGMPLACALNFDHVSLAQRDRFGAVICNLPEERWPEIKRALLIACGFGSAG